MEHCSGGVKSSLQARDAVKNNHGLDDRDGSALCDRSDETWLGGRDPNRWMTRAEEEELC
jgi:hypothetical protein